jgi:hypothetical protein
MSGVLEQVIIIVFSLHLGEPLVLDLAMLSFISRSYTVLHHDFQFFCLIAFIYQAGNLVILDTMTGCSGFSSFLESSCSSSCFSLAFGSMEFLIDSMP